ncbi:spore photoproduct lyase [Caloramator quimbayensis]|uniref:Spore photoproduct lyase n=1 Tax=Caloramator quimbayensis TaxID=1147123 RepID=A0A1T4XFE5_9CLOT|nr:DNA photolyase [Caloramator quimbayensis]SKA87781.1 spore photoproduct lyase [Caloramator quimbayensis]
MSRLSKDSNKYFFDSIYIEEDALNYPITKNIIEKYNASNFIVIKHYKDVFNRLNQNFSVQKQNQSLILAVKNKPFIYRGPDVCQNFGYSNFYYTSFLLNCIFDCEYCYLQGMYPSSNIVAFVNIEDFKSEIKHTVSKETAFLAASYDTDLIAFHSIIPYMDYFYDFFKDLPNLLVEVRTKSANDIFYKTHKPIDNIIIAFTLSPHEIIKKYEKHTPSLDVRIKAVKAAISRGFKVRICLDPIFIGDDVDSFYEPFYNYLFSQINPDDILDIGYGFFRMSKDFFKRIEKIRFDSLLFCENYSLKDDVLSYPDNLQEKIMEKHYKILTKYVDRNKIFSL